MKRISGAELQEHSVAELGLDATSLDLTTPEGIAAALRRAAGFLCPCSEKELVSAVVQCLQDLVIDPEVLRDQVSEALEALLAYGDLVESRVSTPDGLSDKGVLLYLTPPTLVSRKDGSVFLLGIAPDHASPLPNEYAARIDYDGHVRRIAPLPEEPLASSLTQFGLLQLSMEQWLRTPPPMPPRHCILRYDELLAQAPPAGSIPGLRILDPSKPVHYYRGRWVEPGKQNGRFLARRPQAYGAELWSYVELENGHPSRLLDLPQFEKRGRACDEAWRLQAAIDANRSTPQQYRIRQGPNPDAFLLDLFSPVPLWMQRRWNVTGHPAPPSGSLLSYVLPKTALQEERTFMKDMLWLVDSREAGQNGV
jgi:hypothetical protein